MKGIARFVIFVMVLALVGAGSLAAQQQQQQQPPPTKPPVGQIPGAAPPAPEPAPPSPEELAAYKAFSDSLAKKGKDVQNTIRLGEDFTKKFPESRFNATVYASLAAAYQSQNREADMFAAAEKSIELNPDQVDALSLMAWAMPRRLDQNDLALAQKLQRSEDYGRHCVELLENMTKPEGVDEADFTTSKSEKLSMCHSGLGIVLLYTDRYTDSAAELEKATTLSLNPDPVDFFMLGRAYDLLKRFHDSVTAYEKCAEKQSGVQAACKQLLANAKKQAATQLEPPKP
jgi:tetratricopeptide (TPR) repeat protein